MTSSAERIVAHLRISSVDLGFVWFEKDFPKLEMLRPRNRVSPHSECIWPRLKSHQQNLLFPSPHPHVEQVCRHVEWYNSVHHRNTKDCSKPSRHERVILHCVDWGLLQKRTKSEGRWRRRMSYWVVWKEDRCIHLVGWWSVRFRARWRHCWEHGWLSWWYSQSNGIESDSDLPSNPNLD